MVEFRNGLGRDFFPNGEMREMRAHVPHKAGALRNLTVTLGFLLLGAAGAIINLLATLKGFFKKPKSVKGKICLVTGAGRGFGRELCLALAKEGAILACADINSANNEETVRLVQAAGSKAKAYTVNVAVKKDVDDCIALIEEELGPIYLLVNNAALIMPMTPPTEEYTRAIFNVNVLGYIWMLRGVLPKMKSRDEGHIVNISSIAAYFPTSELDLYSSTKAAITSYGQSVRNELLVENLNSKIKITTVHPSFMNTSQDYTDIFRLRLDLTYEMEIIVKDTMNAIKYDKEEVTAPQFLRPVMLMATLFLPSWLYAAVMRSLLCYVKVPTEKDIQLLPVGNIVKNSAFLKEKSS